MPNPPPIQTALTADDSSLQAALDRANARVGTLGEKAETVGSKAFGAAGGMKRLESNLTSLAVGAAGVEPHLGHLAATVAGFGLEGPIMVAALAGLAALAVAWERIGGAARDAAKNQSDAIQRLVEEARIRGLGGPIRAVMGQAITGRAALSARRDELQGSLDRGEIESERVDAATQAVALLTKQIDDLTTGIQESGKQLEEAGAKAGENAADAAVKMADLNAELVRLRAHLSEVTVNFPTSEDILFGRPFGKLNVSGRQDLDVQHDPHSVTGKIGLGGAAGRSLATLDELVRRSAIPKATGDLSRAGQVAVASFGAMAEAAITGSGRMSAAITGALQSIVANIGTKAGGLFGATPWGALAVGAIGIVGSLFGRHREPAPVKVANADEIASKMAAAAAMRPIHVHNTFVTPEGHTIEETEYVLLNREARDATPRYTGRR